MHREHIKHIIEHGTTSQMVELRDVIVNIVDYLKCNDYDEYLCTEYEINKIAHNGHIGEDVAKCWVSKMQNKDGTKGEHWSMEQVANVIKEKGIKYELTDFYTVLNMMYSDYCTSIKKFVAPEDEAMMCASMAWDFLEDVDAPSASEKLTMYFHCIANLK